ncbi:MAG TPA: TraR/DksA C4-type zinc finger protein [Bacillales bacterium]
MALTNTQWNELKEDLLAMKDRLEKETTDSGKQLNSEADELSVVDNHLADSASGIVNREKQMAENSLRDQELSEVHAALERMEQGTYGQCVDTGKEISFERLKAIPYAKRTVAAEEAYTKEKNQDAENPDGQPTTQLQDPDEEVQDTRDRTIEKIHDEHNSVERPDDVSRLNQEPKDDNEW